MKSRFASIVTQCWGSPAWPYVGLMGLLFCCSCGHLQRHPKLAVGSQSPARLQTANYPATLWVADESLAPAATESLAPIVTAATAQTLQAGWVEPAMARHTASSLPHATPHPMQLAALLEQPPLAPVQEAPVVESNLTTLPTVVPRSDVAQSEVPSTEAPLYGVTDSGVTDSGAIDSGAIDSEITLPSSESVVEGFVTDQQEMNVEGEMNVQGDELPAPMCGCGYSTTWRPTGVTGTWPKDEYLCDGGDRLGTVIARANGQLIGVDQQDTVAHIQTRQGDEKIVPSNCICIYAPRFAAVRHLSGLHVNDQNLSLSAVDRPEETIEHMQRDTAEAASQPNGPRENLVLQPPIEAMQLDGGDVVIDRRKVTENRFDLRVAQNLDLLGPQESRERQEVDVADAVLAAIAWSDEVSVQIMLEEEPVAAQVAYLPTEQTYQYSLPPGKPCLKLIKLASRSDAQPGEEVEFLLQFRNTGPDTLEKLTLVDNLTTRLAYIPESQECSLKASFSADDNSADSHVLRWILSEPLRPGDGGVIHFRCTVR